MEVWINGRNWAGLLSITAIMTMDVESKTLSKIKTIKKTYSKAQIWWKQKILRYLKLRMKAMTPIIVKYYSRSLY